MAAGPLKFPERRRLHTCVVCGKAAPWGPAWRWYGSLERLEEQPRKIVKVCSGKCRRAYTREPKERKE